MRTNRSHRLLAGLPLLALLLHPSAVHAAAAGLTFQAKATPAYAKAGSAGWASYAVVTVVVTRASTGLPEGSLAPTVGDGTPLPALPPGFTLRNLWIEPDPVPNQQQVCVPVPVYFRNAGYGAYQIYLAPGRDASCAWRSGDYHVALQFQGNVGADTLAGTGLVEVQVP